MGVAFCNFQLQARLVLSVIATCKIILNTFSIRMPLSKPICGASSSFCGKLKASKIQTRSDGLTLDERVDDELLPVMGKKLKDSIKKEVTNLMLAGAGQSSLSISGSSKMLFQRDYALLCDFDGTTKIGVIMVPSKIIPKYGINLNREKLQGAIDAARQHQFEDLTTKAKKAQRADVGDVPEEEAFDGLEKALEDSLW